MHLFAMKGKQKKDPKNDGGEDVGNITGLAGTGDVNGVGTPNTPSDTKVKVNGGTEVEQTTETVPKMSRKSGNDGGRTTTDGNDDERHNDGKDEGGEHWSQNIFEIYM